MTALTWALASFPEDILSENRVGSAFLFSLRLETSRQLHLLPDTQLAEIGKRCPVCSVWSPADKLAASQTGGRSGTILQLTVFRATWQGNTSHVTVRDSPCCSSGISGWIQGNSEVLSTLN